MCEQEVQVTFQWLQGTVSHHQLGSCQDKNLSVTSSPLPPHSRLHIPSQPHHYITTTSLHHYQQQQHLCPSLCCAHIGGFYPLFLGQMIF